jgi:hypothetical protein
MKQHYYINIDELDKNPCENNCPHYCNEYSKEYDVWGMICTRLTGNCFSKHYFDGQQSVLRKVEKVDKQSMQEEFDEVKKELIVLLDEAHDLLDAHNSLYATDQEYCSYCHAKTYNSMQGIIHYDNCIIKRIRQHLEKSNKIPKIKQPPKPNPNIWNWCLK